MHMLERKCAALADSNTKLAAKTADLEGRNRRNNIRIIGLPEFIKGPRPMAFFSDLFVEIFERQTLQSPPELDRRWCWLPSRPQEENRGLPSSAFTATKRGSLSSKRPANSAVNFSSRGSRSGSVKITLLKSSSSAQDTVKLCRACTTWAWSHLGHSRIGGHLGFGIFKKLTFYLTIFCYIFINNGY